MIGLITSDEAMYAGGIYGTNNKEYYLYSGKWYWTMAPCSFEYSSTSSRAFVHDVVVNGYLAGGYVNFVNNYGSAVRPVVSLKSDAISGGSGTAASPFLVG